MVLLKILMIINSFNFNLYIFEKKYNMGKGDIKSRKGKRFAGSKGKCTKKKKS